MWDCAGSEWRTYELFRQLSSAATVRIWSQSRPAPQFTALAPIRRIRPGLLRFPFGGTIVFVGVYARIGRWLRFARPRRVVVVYNTDAPLQYTRYTRQIERATGLRPEFVFASAWLRQSVGGTGPVEISPIDLQRFTPASTPAAARPFTVGRHSRDSAKKHHRTDPALYERLAANGCRVRLLGGTVLGPALGSRPGIAELLPLNAEPAETFLHSLDCFYYRTSDNFREPHGRVVQEAMACGLPVVAHRDGGYATYIEHGRNGFLFEKQDEAFALLLELRNDHGLRQRLGTAARATVESLFSPAERERMRRFYLEPPTARESAAGAGQPEGIIGRLPTR
jgi:glycosyltransferase involved in cell wall biosynthesis